MLLLLGALGSALLLPGCGDAPRSPNVPTSRGAAPPTRPAARVAVDSARYVFDLPALVNLTADQIKAKLGKPVKDSQESYNDQMKTLLYRRKGYELSIDYEVQSRRLLSIYFSPIKSGQAYPTLLHEANVTPDGGKGYKVDPLNEEGGLYEGIALRLDSARVQDQFGNWVPVEQAQ